MIEFNSNFILSNTAVVWKAFSLIDTIVWKLWFVMEALKVKIHKAGEYGSIPMY
jgi:hypothetical protein